LLGHRLTLRSWPGRGSVFAIEVPRVAPAVRTAGLAQPPIAPVPRARVLVVDNDDAVLRAMQALLGGWDLEVLIAHDGAEALAAVRSARPDLVLLDYHLDGRETGLGVHAAIAATGAAPPAIIISADHGEPVRAAVAAAGLPLLMKPLKPLALKSLMGRMLAAREVVAS
jgi:CheY-like chemotaxis protein